jgi:hypothetical protein
MQVTIEYMILIPVLILQLFLFPVVVSSTMNTWVDSRRTIALEETAGHLGSAIQQVYLSLNHSSIQACTLVNSLELPSDIEHYSYTGNATWRVTGAPDGNRVLDVTLQFVGLKISTTTSVILGENAEWKNSTLKSYYTTPGNSLTESCLIANKTSDGKIELCFRSS